jgi:Ran GTPase-activating protein (RanGAP) involved in mRNA processing and transport
MTSYYIQQTLITLDLSGNQIGDEGVEHLANALQQNKVTQLILFSFLVNHGSIIFYRHSPHLTSVAIKSVMKK